MTHGSYKPINNGNSASTESKSNRMKKSVVAFVFNNCTNDARVLKEAKSLVDAGYDVRILAIKDKTTDYYEDRDGIRIIRFDKDPINVRITRILKIPLSLSSKISGLLSGLVGRRFFLIDISNAIRSSFFGGKDKALTTFQKFILFIFLVLIFVALSWLIIPLAVLGIGFIVLMIVFRKLYKMFFELVKKKLMPYHRRWSFDDFRNKTVNYCVNNPADVYHGHDFITMEAAQIAAKKTNAKMVYDSHELWSELGTLSQKEKDFTTKNEQKFILRADRVITINESIADELIKRYGIKKPTIIMNSPNPIERSVLESGENLLKKATGKDFDEPIILYQGGFSVNRGLELLVEAMQYVERGKLIMMGWGKIEDELKQIAANFKLEDKVFFIPPVSQGELLKYTSGADLGLIPYLNISLNNYYCTPNKLFEYMNAGIAVAASNFPELSKFILREKVGELFEPESAKSIAEAISKVVDNEVNLRKYKENAVEASQKYNWKIEEQKLLSLYKDLLT